MNEKSMEEINNERKESRRDLIKGGAKHEMIKVGGKPTVRLTLTKRQIKEIEFEHELGKYPDAIAYIEANKKIIVPKERAPWSIKELKGKGFISSNTLTLVDEKGNIIITEVDLTKITSIRNTTRAEKEQGFHNPVNKFIDELKMHNLNIFPLDGNLNDSQKRFVAVVRDSMYKEKNPSI